MQDSQMLEPVERTNPISRQQIASAFSARLSEFASLVHGNVANGKKIDMLLCLSVLAPEILSFILETANYVGNVLPRDGRSV